MCLLDGGMAGRREGEEGGRGREREREGERETGRERERYLNNLNNLVEDAQFSERFPKDPKCRQSLQKLIWFSPVL